jgi:hypothetical protein
MKRLTIVFWLGCVFGMAACGGSDGTTPKPNPDLSDCEVLCSDGPDCAISCSDL